jgi:hypothetical protein
LYLPGARLTASIISRTVFAGKFGLATRKKSTDPICAIGAKSRTGSIGDGRYSAGLMPSVVDVAISSV